ncbi:MAG: hypothetical protein JRN15_23355, partial [Nitrososphaerota archaeon]|nr:hypothetical protein [Nitrososphaerota archaeon]
MSAYKSNVILSVLKLLTLFPVIVLLYYADFGDWISAFAGDNLVAFLIAALGIIAIGVWLKRKIIAAYAQISDTSLRSGLLLILVAAAVYVSGSYTSQYTGLMHYESMILLIAGYTALRFDKSLLGTMAPLFAIAGVVFAPTLTESLLGQWISGIYTVLLFVGLFVIFVGNQLRLLLIPSAMSVFGLAYWLAPSIGSISIPGLFKFSVVLLFVSLLPMLYLSPLFRDGLLANSGPK